MAKVELAVAAVEDLDRLIVTLTLPADTRERVRTSLAVLRLFPRLGPKLEGRWSGLRFILGPWRWMLIVYQFDEPGDRVMVITIQDARSSRAAASRC
jgi:plasmid stabilization system protein ParE